MEKALQSEMQLTTMLQNMRVSRTDKGLYLYGTAGTGKTTIARMLFDKLTDNAPHGFKSYKDKKAMFIQTAELLLEIRSAFTPKSEISEGDIIEKYTTCEYLFLDDFGAEKQSEFTLETLYIILDRCERNHTPTLIITSNYELEHIAKNVSDRIASRIAGICDIIKIAGDDNRIKTKTSFQVNAGNNKAIAACEAIWQHETIKRDEIKRKIDDEKKVRELEELEFKKQQEESEKELLEYVKSIGGDISNPHHYASRKRYADEKNPSMFLKEMADKEIERYGGYQG